MKSRVVIILVLVSILAFIPTLAKAQTSESNEEEQTISVTSKGKVKVTPDVAYLLLGVKTQALSVQEALKENNRIMDLVIKELKAKGIKGENIRVIGPVMRRAGRAYFQREAPTGFEVAKKIIVTLDKIGSDPDKMGERVAEIIDGTTKAGANIWGKEKGYDPRERPCILFSVKEVEKYREQALERALAKAKPEVEKIAANKGLKIKKIKSISKWKPVSGPDSWWERGYGKDLPEGPKVDSLKDIEISVSVRVTYTVE